MLKSWKNRISLRRIHIWMIIVLMLVTVTFLFTMYQLKLTFLRFEESYKEHSELQNAARELMDASDYLTEQVQRFTVTADRQFLDQYFTEAFETNRREDALSKMNSDPDMQPALEQLQEAMDHSVKLMDQEYYAMRLVVEAKGYTDYPDILKNVELTVEDSALSDDDKLRLATELVHNDNYYIQKDNIRSNMKESLLEIDKQIQQEESIGYIYLRHNMRIVYATIFLHAVAVISMLSLAAHLGVKPILRAVDMIKADRPIPEVGAGEFKYLAQAYNKMYSNNKKNIESLNYKATHDELTGAFNRTGYDFLLSNIDFSTTHVMLLDVDSFKSINDNYGHEIGDRILIKIVDVLKSVFRDDDRICRIGGDEFVVFMVHSSQTPRRLIESKINQINNELEDTEDGLPTVSVSVGIVNGKDFSDIKTLLEKTDASMYESKKHGKHTYTFYSNETEGDINVSPDKSAKKTDSE